MFSTERPYRFHIELTDKCNAACPMCPRTDHMNSCKTDYSKVQKIELSLADFEQHFNDAFCRHVEEVELGGGLGDALAASQCLEICEHLISRDVRVLISTNGSLRSTAWWEELGRLFRRNDSFVELHVDGLRDTNGLYRVNTNFDKIMENARAYLATGAVAEWHYILFKHNEHQAAEAARQSREMGFRKFVLIDTIRFGSKAHFDYQMPNGEWRSLEPPSYRSNDFATRFGREASDDSPNPVTPVEKINGIACKSKTQNRAYINTEGYVSACCWMSGSSGELHLTSLAGKDREAFNIRNRDLADILQDEPFNSIYLKAWLDGSSATCKRKCGDMIRNTRLAV